MTFQAFDVSYKSLNDADRKLLKKYLLDLALKRQIGDLLPCIQTSDTLSKMFDKSDLQYIKNSDLEIQIPESLHRTSWTLYDCTKKRKFALVK